MKAKEMFSNMGFKQFLGTSTKWQDYIEYQNDDKYIWFYNREIQCNDENNHILKMLKRDGLVEEAYN